MPCPLLPESDPALGMTYERVSINGKGVRRHCGVRLNLPLRSLAPGKCHRCSSKYHSPSLTLKAALSCPTLERKSTACFFKVNIEGSGLKISNLSTSWETARKPNCFTSPLDGNSQGRAHISLLQEMVVRFRYEICNLHAGLSFLMIRRPRDASNTLDFLRVRIPRTLAAAGDSFWTEAGVAQSQIQKVSTTGPAKYSGCFCVLAYTWGRE